MDSPDPEPPTETPVVEGVKDFLPTVALVVFFFAVGLTSPDTASVFSIGAATFGGVGGGG